MIYNVFIILSPNQMALINVFVYLILILSLGLISIIIFLHRKNKHQDIRGGIEVDSLQENKAIEEKPLFVTPIANVKFLMARGEYRKAIVDGYLALRKDLSITFMVTPMTYMTEYEIIKNILEKVRTSSFRSISSEIETVLLKIYKLYEKTRFSNEEVTINDCNSFVENIELLKKMIIRQVGQYS